MAWTHESITTERLRLRPFRGGDRPAIVALFTDPDVRRYLGGPIERSVVEERLHNEMPGSSWGVFCVADRLSDAAIGSCSFSRGRGELELSYALLPASWGGGLAHEACRGALDWAWANVDDPAVIAVTQAANTASRRLLQRLGFTEEVMLVEWDADQVQARLERPHGGAGVDGDSPQVSVQRPT